MADRYPKLKSTHTQAETLVFAQHTSAIFSGPQFEMKKNQDYDISLRGTTFSRDVRHPSPKVLTPITLAQRQETGAVLKLWGV